MTAKEYYISLKEAIETGTATALSDAVNKMIISMSREVRELVKTRHVHSDHDLVSIIKEMNDKWNAIACLAKKDYGMSPIYRDGFKNYWAGKLPELRSYI